MNSDLNQKNNESVRKCGLLSDCRLNETSNDPPEVSDKSNSFSGYNEKHRQDKEDTKAFVYGKAEKYGLGGIEVYYVH